VKILESECVAALVVEDVDFEGSAVGRVQAVLNAMSELQRAGLSHGAHRRRHPGPHRACSRSGFGSRPSESTQSTSPRSSARSGAATRSASSCARSTTGPGCCSSWPRKVCRSPRSRDPPAAGGAVAAVLRRDRRAAPDALAGPGAREPRRQPRTHLRAVRASSGSGRSRWRTHRRGTGMHARLRRRGADRIYHGALLHAAWGGQRVGASEVAARGVAMSTPTLSVATAARLSG
jgi:hypothetical protein